MSMENGAHIVGNSALRAFQIRAARQNPSSSSHFTRHRRNTKHAASTSVERCPARLSKPSSPTTKLPQDTSSPFQLGQDTVQSPPTGSLRTDSLNLLDSPVISENILADEDEDEDMEAGNVRTNTKDDKTNELKTETATLSPAAPSGFTQRSTITNPPCRISDVSVDQDTGNDSVLYDSEQEENSEDDTNSMSFLENGKGRVCARYNLRQKLRIVQ